MKKTVLFFLLLLPFFVAYAADKENTQEIKSTTTTLQKEDKYFPVWIWGEVYYWKVEEGGLGFVFDESSSLQAGQGVSGDLMRGRYDWHLGFRVALGYDISPDYWTIEAQYGSINPNDKQVVNRHQGDVLHATFPNEETSIIYKAKSYLSLTTHFGDLLLKKKFHPASTIDMWLIGGLTMAWMKQNWKINYYDENFIDRCFKPKWHYKGGGIKIGTHVDWLLGKGFTLLLKGAGSLLMGNYDNRLYAHDTNTITQDRVILANTHYDDFRVATNLQVAFGPSWQWQWNTLFMKIFLGYEMNTWLNVVEIHNQNFYANLPNTYVLTSNMPAIISAQGATFGMYFNF